MTGEGAAVSNLWFTNFILIERVVDGGQDGVRAPSAVAPEVVGGQVPDHCPAEALLDDEFRLDAGRLGRIVPDPLITLREEEMAFPMNTEL